MLSQILEDDTQAETVPFLEEDDDEGGGDKLDDEQEADTYAEVAGLTVEIGENVYGGLSEGNNKGEEFLSAAEQSPIFLESNNCMIMPEVTIIGLIPNSIRALRFDARMTRIQYRGSDESDDMIPYSGTWQ